MELAEKKSKRGTVDDTISEVMEDDQDNDAACSNVMRTAGDITFNDGDSAASGVEGDALLDNPFGVTAPGQCMFYGMLSFVCLWVH